MSLTHKAPPNPVSHTLPNPNPSMNPFKTRKRSEDASSTKYLQSAVAGPVDAERLGSMSLLLAYRRGNWPYDISVGCSTGSTTVYEQATVFLCHNPIALLPPSSDTFSSVHNAKSKQVTSVKTSWRKGIGQRHPRYAIPLQINRSGTTDRACLLLARPVVRSV